MKTIYFASLPEWAKMEVERSYYRSELIREEAVRKNAEDWQNYGTFSTHGDRLAYAAAASNREHRALFDCFLR